MQQFFQSIKLRSALTQTVRFRQLNNRYSISDSILAILYPIILGLGRMETNTLLQQNGVFQFLASLPTYPDPTTLRRFLERFGSRGLTSFQNLHDRFRSHFLMEPDPISSVIFDLDTKVLTVYGQQRGAKVGFNPKKRGCPSYQPLLCFEGKTGDIWEGIYLSGDIHPAPHTIKILDRSLSKLPSGIREIRARADSAFYDHTIAEYLQEVPAFYAIVARITKPIQRYFGGLRYEEVFLGFWVAEFEYKPWRWKTAQRFIVVRRLIPEGPSWQLSLFKMTGYTYHVIVTNLSLKPPQSLAFLQSESHGGTYHSRTPRSLYTGQNTNKRLGFQSSLFSLGPLCLQLDQLAQTMLSPSRLATAQSSDDSKSVAFGASPISSLSRKTSIESTEQLPLCENIYPDFKKH